MYTLGKEIGYDTRVVNSTPSFIDYIPTSSWGYSQNVVNAVGGLVDYIEHRDYYTCAVIDILPPVTWDVWSVNWENINTNWNNEVFN